MKIIIPHNAIAIAHGKGREVANAIALKAQQGIVIPTRKLVINPHSKDYGRFVDGIFFAKRDLKDYIAGLTTHKSPPDEIWVVCANRTFKEVWSKAVGAVGVGDIEVEAVPIAAPVEVEKETTDVESA